MCFQSWNLLLTTGRGSERRNEWCTVPSVGLEWGLIPHKEQRGSRIEMTLFVVATALLLLLLKQDKQFHVIMSMNLASRS